MESVIHQPHDKLFKQAMSDIRVAEEFFRRHLPRSLIETIDLTTLSLQKQSFIDDHFKANEADVLYSIQLGDQIAYLYLLCEHQTEIDSDIAFRLLVYIVRIMERHRKQHPDKTLPVIYPMVLYTGKKRWDAPLDVFTLFGEQESLARKILFQPCQLIELNQFEDDALRTHLWSGIVEFVLKYQKVRDLASYLDIAFPWIQEIEWQSGFDFAKIVLCYMVNGINAKDGDLFVEKANTYLSTKLKGETMTLAEYFEEKGMKKGIERGIRKGKVVGILEGERNILINQLRCKFGQVPESYYQQLANASSEMLLAWSERIVDAASLEDIFFKEGQPNSD